MTDRVFLYLASRWALGYDNLQWILLKAEKPAQGADLRHPSVRWRGVSFIASEKRTLVRVLREMGAQLTSHAKEVINAMPKTFREWYWLHQARPTEIERTV